MWDAYNKTTFGEQYQRGKKYRERREGDSAREVECGAGSRLIKLWINKTRGVEPDACRAEPGETRKEV
jgi:hypothetical protein